MRNASRVQLCLAAIALVAAAGAADAARSAIWDQLFVLALVVVLAVTGLIVGRSDRPVVSLRVDLARWLRDRSAVEGEPVDALLDRTVAAARRDHTAEHDGRA